jgi:hypothetical protein
MWAETARHTCGGMTDDPVIIYRSLLFTVAYEMLGSARTPRMSSRIPG